MNRRCVQACVFAVCCLPLKGLRAQADWRENDWETYASTPKTVFQWNTVRTQKATDGVIATWVREIGRPAGTEAIGKPGLPDRRQNMSLVHLSCDARRLRFVGRYDPGNAVPVMASAPGTKRGLRSPDAAGAALIRAVCASMESG